MTKFAHLAQRLFNTPVMIRADKAEMIVAALSARLGIGRFDTLAGETLTVVQMGQQAAVATSGDRRERKIYQLVDGIAIIPIEGTLAHKYGELDPYSGITGYDGIATKLREAMADDDVRGIWFDINSPGGEVAGCFDLADEIAANRKSSGGKPIWCFANEMACSAAYALACSGDKLFTPRTGIVGSIGCYILFVDWTDALSADGLKVTFFREGDMKARGSGLEPMDDETAVKLQSSVKATRDLFAKHVATHRRISVKGVLDTRSDWFDAADALSLGLVDGVMSEIEGFAKFQRSLARAG